MSTNHSSREASPSEVKRTRNKYNRWAIYTLLALCVVMLFSNVYEIWAGAGVSWRILFGFTPAILAFLMWQRLGQYKDSING
jgi:hypothetical protein